MKRPTPDGLYVIFRDGASVERWEDDEMRSSFADILRGDWKHHDPYALTGRLKGNSNLYGRPNQVSRIRLAQLV